MHNVFVYGTLKRGFQNHNKWMTKAKFIENVTTQEKFTLIVGGQHYFPALVKGIKNPNLIKGELFTVDDAGLKMLDEIEGVGEKNGYIRCITKVNTKNSQKEYNAFIYIKERSSIENIRNYLSDEYLLDNRYIPAELR